MEAKRRAMYKKGTTRLYSQDRRRKAALSRQKEARERKANLWRKIVEFEDDAMSEDEDTAALDRTKARRKKQRYKSRAKFYSSMLMVHEWMLDVPTDLDGKGETEMGWLVFPRPEGKQCLIVSLNGWTTCRSRHGDVLARFESGLPGGSRDTCRSKDSSSILEAIYYAPTETYYICDYLRWNVRHGVRFVFSHAAAQGFEFFQCSAECRQFFGRQKLLEELKPSAVKLEALPCYECNLDGLHAAYSTDLPFERDGLLFMCRASDYESGVTPVGLRWKDSRTSKWPVDTDKSASADARQTVCLRCTKDQSLMTEEGIVVHTLPPAEKQFEEGSLLRFLIDGVTVEMDEPSVVKPEFLGKAGKKRLVADFWSKIVFQDRIRKDPLTIEAIATAVGESVVETAVEEGEEMT